MLVDEQGGFRKGRGCVDQIFVLTEVLAKRKQERKKTFLCFIDMRKAYDRVWRDGLWAALWRQGVRGRLWRFLRSYYSKVKSKVRLGRGETEWFHVDVGVRQGCVLSPVLFAIFIDRLAQEVKRLGVGIPAGLRRSLALLLYADDIVLVADTQEDLQKMTDSVEKFCDRWRMEVNAGKTKVMVVGTKEVGEVEIMWKGKALEEVVEYKYLGLLLERNGWKKQKGKMMRKARRALGLAWNLAIRAGNMSVRGMNNMWTALIRPHLEYGAEIMNTVGDYKWNEAEALMRKVGRLILKCGRTLPNDAIAAELGWMTMKGRRQLLRLSYWGKIVTMDKRRWVWKMYEEGRRRLESNARANTWCNLTKKWMLELGFDEEWDAQEAGGRWQERVRAAVMALEQKKWRARVAASPKLDFYAAWKKDIEREDYLDEADEGARRLWTKVRTGCLELRIETGRWERVSVRGMRLPIPRKLRLCRMCGAETEDVEHVMLRCPSYGKERLKFIEVGHRNGVQRGARPAEWWRWIFEGGGGKEAREFMKECMRKRKKLLEGLGIA